MYEAFLVFIIKKKKKTPYIIINKYNTNIFS